MIKSKFAEFLDMTFFIIGFALISFAWINKYVKITWLSLVIIAVLCFVLAKIIWSISTKRYNKHNLKNSELKFAQSCIDYLCLNPTKALPLFSKIIKGSTKNGNFLVKKDNLYYFDYASEQTTTLTISKIENKLKQTKKLKCYLFANSLTPKALSLLSSNIIFVSPEDAYMLMQNQQIYPITPSNVAKIKKNRLKNAVKNVISRKKAKPYIIYGALLICTGFLLPYSVFYTVIGSLSVSIGLVCLCVRNYNDKPNILS